MFKRFFACFVFLLVMVSSAWSETSLRIEWRVLAGITEGHSDYSDARFGCVRMRVRDRDPADENISGTLTLSGGNYLYYDGDVLKRVSGTSETFTLRPREDRSYYLLRNKEGTEIRLALEDENGLNGVTASWSFPDRPSMNGQTVITEHRTVEEQLNSFVPYFEYILDGSKVTGISWRVVNPSDTSKPVSQDFYMGFCFWDGRYNLEKYVSVADDWVDIQPGTTPEGVFMFEEAVEASDMDEIDLELRIQEDKDHIWQFYTPKETEPNLWSNYRATASIINGKSNYRNAKFHSIGIFPQVNNVRGELKCFTNTGQFTVPGGDYTIIARDSAETPTILETVAAGTDRTFGLIPDEESAIGSNYTFTYRLVHSSGEDFTFGGNAEHNLAGKTFTWTFPAELSYLNGSGTVPNYKSVSEQLRTGVPYIELVSADGYVTAINYKIVTSSDTSTAITPSYRTDFSFYVNTDTATIGSGTIDRTTSGTYTLSTPVVYESIINIVASLRSYEDSGYLPHTWDFYPASDDTPDPDPDPDPDPTPTTRSSSSGGCSAGFTFAALALTAILIKKH